MGYKITLVNGKPERTYDQDETIATDIALSLLVEQGSWFFDRTFGRRKRNKKNTAQSIGELVQDCNQALKWLLDTGKAKSIDVIAEPDVNDRTRANVMVTAGQANDKIVTFQTFISVI